MNTMKANFKKESFIVHNRKSHYGDDAAAISEIFQEEINISVWQRKLNSAIKQASELIIKSNPNLQISGVIKPNEVNEILISEIGSDEILKYFYKDVSMLVKMFHYLFDIKNIGFRLRVLDHAMCPRFHVDRVPCRLITTYRGIASEWLPHNKVDRGKLGAGNQGKPDEESGIYKNILDIKHLNEGDVGLFKGESWQGNEGAGLVHRSPKVKNEDQKRLLLTLDFVDNTQLNF